MSVPHGGAEENRERQKKEELPSRRRRRVCPRGKRQPTKVPTQIEASSSLGDHGEGTDGNEGHGQPGTIRSHATMNGSAAGSDQSGLREKQQEPHGGQDGMYCHERSEWKGYASLRGIDDRRPERHDIEEDY